MDDGDEKKDSEAVPPDRARWEEHLSRWQQVEATFAQDPAEGLRAAERLRIDLSGSSADSPTRVVREMAWKREYSLGGGTPGADANLLSALFDLAGGVQESVRMVQRAQAAARGINAARDHRAASSEENQQAMELYRDAVSRLLGVKRDQLAALGSGTETPAAGKGLPGEQSTGSDETLRDRILAEKLVRESMIPLEQAEARADRWRIARWGMVQLVASLVVGLLMLAVVIWVLSLQ
jgi:hypothetical protein